MIFFRSCVDFQFSFIFPLSLSCSRVSKSGVSFSWGSDTQLYSIGAQKLPLSFSSFFSLVFVLLCNCCICLSSSIAYDTFCFIKVTFFLHHFNSQCPVLFYIHCIFLYTPLCCFPCRKNNLSLCIGVPPPLAGTM